MIPTADSSVRQPTWLAAWRRRPSIAAQPRGEAGARGLHYLLGGDTNPVAVADETRPDSSDTPRPGSLPEAVVAAQNGLAYRVPADLRRTDMPIRRVLVIGSCLYAGWISANRQSGASFDYIATNNFSPLPEAPPAAIEEYDFQIVQIPLRSIMHENTYSHLPPTIAAYEELFGSVTSWLTQYLDIALAWNTRHGLLSFVSNFMVPQQNPLGRLLPRNDLRNLIYFTERLNEYLYRDIAGRNQVHLFDIDQICLG